MTEKLTQEDREKLIHSVGLLEDCNGYVYAASYNDKINPDLEEVCSLINEASRKLQQYIDNN